MRVESFLLESARRFPGKTALVCGATRLAYQQLAERCGALAVELRRQGVVRGDRVAVFLHNSPEALISIFGTLLAGAVFSVVNPCTKAEKLAYILNHCTAKVLITEPRLAEIADAARSLAPAVAATLVTPFSFDEAPAPSQPGIDLDLAMIVYTSGSTAFPNAVRITLYTISAPACSNTH